MYCNECTRVKLEGFELKKYIFFTLPVYIFVMFVSIAGQALSYDGHQNQKYITFEFESNFIDDLYLLKLKDYTKPYSYINQMAELIDSKKTSRSFNFN